MKKVIILILGVLIAGSGFFLVSNDIAPPKMTREADQDTDTKQEVIDETEKSEPLYVVQLDGDVGLLFKYNLTRENGSPERLTFLTDEEILGLRKTMISKISDSGDFGAVLNMIHTNDLNILIFNLELIPGVHTYKYNVKEDSLQIIKRDKGIDSVPYFLDITENGRYLAYSLYYWYSENPPGDVILYDTVSGIEKNVGVITDFEWLDSNGDHRYKTCTVVGDSDYVGCSDTSKADYINGTF